METQKDIRLAVLIDADNVPYSNVRVAVGSGQLAVGSWQWAVGSLQMAVGSWQLAVGSLQFAVGSLQWAVGPENFREQWAVGKLIGIFTMPALSDNQGVNERVVGCRLSQSSGTPSIFVRQAQ